MGLMVKRERGQGLPEYALILVLVALAVLVILTVLGGSIRSIYYTLTTVFGGSSGFTSTVSGGSVTLRWPAVPNADGYEVRVHHNPGGPVADRSLASCTGTCSATFSLAPGNYRWKVITTLNGDDAGSIWYNFTIP